MDRCAPVVPEGKLSAPVPDGHEGADMTTAVPTTGDVLVLDYLAELWAAGEDLPPEVRDDLMNTVAGYLAMRQDLVGGRSEAVSRLGPPDQLVAAVRRSGTPTHLRLPVAPAGPSTVPPAGPSGASAIAPSSVASGPGRTGRGSERAAIGLLAGGALVLPGAAQAAAMLIVSRSPAWTRTEKAAAWLLVAGPATGLFLALSVLTAVSLLSGVSVVAFYLAMTVGSVAAGLTLRRSL